jgi:hypothetical protein
VNETVITVQLKWSGFIWLEYGPMAGSREHGNEP